MTIGDRPGELAVGYLLNQNMLRLDDRLTGIEHDDELEVVVVRTQRATDYEAKLRKKIRTSGCAVGTVFGDMMEQIDGVVQIGREACRERVGQSVSISVGAVCIKKKYDNKQLH